MSRGRTTLGVKRSLDAGRELSAREAWESRSLASFAGAQERALWGAEARALLSEILARPSLAEADASLREWLATVEADLARMPEEGRQPSLGLLEALRRVAKAARVAEERGWARAPREGEGEPPLRRAHRLTREGVRRMAAFRAAGCLAERPSWMGDPGKLPKRPPGA